jgi:hypothetical protein
MAKIDFSFETKYGVFSDALNLSAEEEAALTPEDIEALKQQRLTNWLGIIEAAQVIEAPVDPQG